MGMLYAAVFLLIGAVIADEAIDLETPSFLQGQPQKLIDEFHAIIKKDHDATDAKLEEDMDAWAKNLPEPLQAAYKKFEEELEKDKAQVEAHRAAGLEKLSKEAKEADEKLIAISNDPKLTGKEKHEKIEKEMEKLPPSVRQELEKAMNGTTPA